MSFRQVAGLALLASLATACGGSVVSCEDDTRVSNDGPPVAAVGPEAPFTSCEAIAVSFGPYPDGAIVDELELGGAPGWGCSSPSVLRVSAWASKADAPAGDPTQRAERVQVLGTTDLGEGFSARRVALPEPVYVPPGAFLHVAMMLDEADACGAKTHGATGRSWQWRNGQWTALDGELVATVVGCVEQSPAGE